MKIEYKGMNFVLWLLAELAKEALKLIHGEYKEIFENTVPVEFKIVDNFIEIRRWLAYNSSFTSEELNDYLGRLQNETAGSDMQAFFEVFIGNDDKTVHLTKLRIEFRREGLLDMIAYHIDTLEDVISYLKLAVRHEVGHLVDYISYEGMSEEEFDEIRRKNNNDKSEFFEKWKDKWFSEERCRAYFSIPEEARANMYGGVDIDKLMELNDRFAFDRTNKKISMTLTTTVEEIKEENK